MLLKVGWVTPAVASPLAKKSSHSKATEEVSSAYSSAQNVALVMVSSSASAYAGNYPLPEAQVTKIRDALQEAVLNINIGNLRVSDHGDVEQRPSRLRRLKSATSLRSKRTSAAEDRVFMAPPVSYTLQLQGGSTDDMLCRRKVSVP